MNKAKAIELLKQALSEIPNLREQHYDNQEFILWHDKVQNIIRANLEPEDVKRFTSSRSVHVKGMFSDSVYQQDYVDRLTDYETALKSIIQKYEILGVEAKPATIVELAPKAFISHGKESAALNKLEEFLSTLGIETLIVKERPSLDKTVNEKVDYYLEQADFVVILATGDDEFEGKLHPRHNVIHEIGLAQKTHQGRIIYLLEEGTEFPSNIRPKVWESFKQRNMMNAFLGIVRELRAYGMLKVLKSHE